MRESIGTVGAIADLIVGDSVSNIVHEFRYNPNILIILRATRGLNASQYHQKFVLDPIEGARKESVQGWLNGRRSNLREQVSPSH